MRSDLVSTEPGEAPLLANADPEQQSAEDEQPLVKILAQRPALTRLPLQKRAFLSPHSVLPFVAGRTCSTQVSLERGLTNAVKRP